MLKEAQIPIEFQPKALITITYIRNRLLNSLEVDSTIISLYKAFISKVLTIDYIRVQGYKAIVYIDLRSYPQGIRRDKLINRGKDTVFIRYIENTTKQQLFQEPNIRVIKAYTTIDFFKEEKGG